MPKRKQPATLEYLSLRATGKLIYDKCVAIETLYGSYDNSECVKAVNNFQDLLCQLLVASLFEKVYETRDVSLEYELSDHRILLATYITPRRTSLSCVDCSLRAIQDELFWVENIKRMKNLTVLNLKLNCTDDILKLVGENCVHLQKINCVSRMRAMSRSPVDFNALRVCLSVTDEGLLYLKNCQKLRVVIMNKKMNGNFSGKRLTYAGVRALVKALPLLEHISFEDLGGVLVDQMDDVSTLKIKKISDICASHRRMKLLIKLCPDLTEVNLLNMEEPSATASALAAVTDSNLQINHLDLPYVNFDNNVVSFFQNKGIYLYYLDIHSPTGMNQQHVAIIAENCPNLRDLSIYNLESYNSLYTYHTKRKNIYLKDLRNLRLFGSGWSLFKLIPLCISSSKYLTNLYICNSHCEESFDDFFLYLMKEHELKYLTDCRLYKDCKLEPSILKAFINHCVNLTKIEVDPKMYSMDEFDEINEYFQGKNYDITITKGWYRT